MPQQADDDSPQFIVAEISTTWPKAWPPDRDTIGAKFELVIGHNLARGYRLHSFQLHQVMTAPERLTETIVAVFERATQ